MTGRQLWESQRIVATSRVELWRRRLVVALASLWIIDGLLQLQPSMYSRGLNGFLANVLQYNTMGKPNPLTELIHWSVTLSYGTPAHQTIFNTLAAIIQLTIGAALLVKRTEIPALAASAVWAFVPWVIGEAMGQMLFPQASMALSGTPGAALIYIILSIILSRSRNHGTELPATLGCDLSAAADDPNGCGTLGSVADIGIVGSTLARAMWAVIWIGSAMFELEFSNWAPDGISAQLKAASLSEPSLIAHMDRFLSHLSAGRGTLVALSMAVVQAWVGAAILRPNLCRIALRVGIAISLIYWIAGQNFGGLFTGNATDPNLGPVMVLFALVLWPIADKGSTPTPVGQISKQFQAKLIRRFE